MDISLNTLLGGGGVNSPSNGGILIGQQALFNDRGPIFEQDGMVFLRGGSQIDRPEALAEFPDFPEDLKTDYYEPLRNEQISIGSGLDFSGLVKHDSGTHFYYHRIYNNTAILFHVFAVGGLFGSEGITLSSVRKSSDNVPIGGLSNVFFFRDRLHAISSSGLFAFNHITTRWDLVNANIVSEIGNTKINQYIWEYNGYAYWVRMIDGARLSLNVYNITNNTLGSSRAGILSNSVNIDLPMSAHFSNTSANGFLVAKDNHIFLYYITTNNTRLICSWTFNDAGITISATAYSGNVGPLATVPKVDYFPLPFLVITLNNKVLKVGGYRLERIDSPSITATLSTDVDFTPQVFQTNYLGKDFLWNNLNPQGLSWGNKTLYLSKGDNVPCTIPTFLIYEEKIIVGSYNSHYLTINLYKLPRKVITVKKSFVGDDRLFSTNVYFNQQDSRTFTETINYMRIK